jgi:hypothetical protein
MKIRTVVVVVVVIVLVNRLSGVGGSDNWKGIR